MEMISYYFEREEFSKSNNIFQDKKTDIENAEFNLEDIGFQMKKLMKLHIIIEAWQ